MQAGAHRIRFDFSIDGKCFRPGIAVAANGDATHGAFAF
jgi:hypothetical protein